MDPQPKKQRLQCEFILEIKKRRCGMTRANNDKDIPYCYEHRATLGLDGQQDRKRVPCTLDPSHTVWEHELQAHLKKCNKLKLLHSNDGKPYFLKDCNVLRTTDVAVDKAAKDDYISRVLSIIQNYSVGEVTPSSIKQNRVMEDKRFPQLDSDDSIGKKYHAVQQSSLIQNMLDLDIINTANTNNFVEFGCGRAELSRYINQVLTATSFINNTLQDKPSHFVLVDRATNRMKFDNKMKKDVEEITKNAQPPQVDRFRIDIKDLNLLPALHTDGSKYVAISKHLCGVATDLTLNSLVGKTENHSDFLQGACIAMCCRHVCNANSYINPGFIKSILAESDTDMSYEEFFFALSKIAPWATSGTITNESEEPTHFTKLSIEERIEVGLKARRIIDQGRCDWLKQKLDNDIFDVKLIRYVEPSVSLENVALLIYRK